MKLISIVSVKMDCVSSYYLQELTEHGGIEKDYGQAVLEYDDKIMTLSTYKYSTEHLGKRTRTSLLFRALIRREDVDPVKLDNYIKYFYNGFYCPYHIRFCEYDTYKNIALRELNKLSE